MADERPVRVEETALPGVGVRYDFLPETGARIGVVVHAEGDRELVVYDRVDADACSLLLRLTDDDARTLAELLAGARHEERRGR